MGQATFTLPDEDWAWLRAQAKSMGMSVGEFGRSLFRAMRLQWEAEQVEDEPLTEEVDVPIDDDAATSEALTRLLQAAQSRTPDLEPLRSREQHRRPAVMDGRPGSLTRPVGVNPEVAIGSYMGDGRGNVTRQNFKHLGFSPR